MSGPRGRLKAGAEAEGPARSVEGLAPSIGEVARVVAAAAARAVPTRVRWRSLLPE